MYDGCVVVCIVVFDLFCFEDCDVVYVVIFC